MAIRTVLLESVVLGTAPAPEEAKGETAASFGVPWYAKYANLDTITLARDYNVVHMRSCPHFPYRNTPEGTKPSDILRKVDTEAQATLYDDCHPWCTRYVWVTVLEGKVLCTRERNGYQDSDFYAIVWDPAEKRCRYFEYATTRFAGGGSAMADATEEVKEQAAGWLVQWYAGEWDKYDERQAAEIGPEKWVRVISGRKVPVGTVGIVKRYIPAEEAQYGRARVKIVERDTYSEYWTNASNCEVIEPESYRKTDVERTKFLAGVRKGQRWHAPFAAPGYVMIG